MLGKDMLQTVTQSHPAKQGSSATPTLGSSTQHSKEKPKLPTRAEISCMKAQIAVTLEKLDAAALPEIDNSEETIVSIYIHFSDLCRTVKTLNGLLKGDMAIRRQKTAICTPKEDENPQTLSFHPEISVEHPRGLSLSPTPFDSSLIDIYSSVYSDAEPTEESLLPFCHAQINFEQHSTPPTSTSVYIAPLKIPTRVLSLTSAGNAPRFNTPEPFEQEIRELNTRIEESSQPGFSQRHSTTAYDPVMSRHQTTRFCCQGLFDSPCPFRPFSVPISDSETDKPRQFISNSKTHHLRSMSGPSYQSIESRDGSIFEERADLDDEPLSMDELISFLRERNSIRDL